MPTSFIVKRVILNVVNKVNFDKHLLTRKHKMIKMNPNEKMPKKCTPSFICNCGKSYKHASSLSYHKKTCNFKK